MTIRAELDNMRERIETSDDVNDLAHVARTDAVRLLDAVEKVLAMGREYADRNDGFMYQHEADAHDARLDLFEQIEDAITTALEGK